MMGEPIPCASPRRGIATQRSEIDIAISRVLNSDSFILGEEVSSFEQEFADYIGAKFCVGVNSGTDALIISLKSLEIGPGDEVILPSHTAVATAASVVACGATPVFVDINIDTYTIDPEMVRAAISPRTKAIIAVHLYGHPCDMDELTQISDESGIFLIEDCAQAHGAKWKNRKVGTFGVMGCFSFYPTKNLGAIGDGGAIVSNDFTLVEKMRSLRQYGWDSSRNSQLLNGVSRLDEIQAAILRVRLKALDDQNIKRFKIAMEYRSELNDARIFLPKSRIEIHHVYHLFVVRSSQRESLIESLNQRNIFPGIHYPVPVHAQGPYKNFRQFNPQSLANTEKISGQILSLPLYPEMTDEELRRVIEAILIHEEEKLETSG